MSNQMLSPISLCQLNLSFAQTQFPQLPPWRQSFHGRWKLKSGRHNMLNQMQVTAHQTIYLYQILSILWFCSGFNASTSHHLFWYQLSLHCLEVPLLVANYESWHPRVRLFLFNMCSGKSLLPVPRHPWSHIALDFVTGLTTSQGNTVILTIMNCISKAVHFTALPKLPTATETAKLLKQHVFWQHRIPADVVSGQGPQFATQVWKAFCSVIGASVSLISDCHPQSNGQTERANQDMEFALRCVTSDNPYAWSSELVGIVYAHNYLTSVATGLSPFEPSIVSLVNHNCFPHKK